MNSATENKRRMPVRVVAVTLITVASMLPVLFWIGKKPALKQNVSSTRNLATAKPVNSGALGGTPAAKPAVMPNSADFQPHPFPVAYETTNSQWTVVDGKDTNSIRRLAHNNLEYERMVDENSRIFRRQLVYLKQTVASVFEQAKLTGQPVQLLTLPGIDGQELQFQIVKSNSDGSSRQGQFYGHLAGDVNSLVTLAFQDGREAYTVLSPSENLYVVAEPRESGQVIVKAIDPNLYGLGPPENDANDAIPQSAKK